MKRDPAPWLAALALIAAATCIQAAEPYVRASQLGYDPSSQKIAIAFSTRELPRTFRVIRATDGAVVLERKAKPVFPPTPWGNFSYHAELDFSSLKQPGTYVLSVGAERSLPVIISAKSWSGIPDALLEFMREQRCGYNPWLDAECHQADGRTAYGPLPEGSKVDARGGWHDAADLLKYLLTSGNATAQMLLAYQVTYPGASSIFSNQVNNLGQPRPNHLPDVLDEAHWGLEWMLKLHPAPDQLYHQVADDRDHIGLRLPQNEIADYGWGKGGARTVYYADGQPQGLQQYKSVSTGIANLAGRYAAAMALAFQVFKDNPAEQAFAERCLKAGREVYALGRAREGVQQGNSYRAPYRYEEGTWADDMEWGAAELYRATGEPAYLADAQRYALLAGSESWMGRRQVAHYQFYPFMDLGHFRLHGLAGARFDELLSLYYREGIERCVTASLSNPYRIGTPFIWCSNNLIVALVTQCLLYERMTGDDRYRAFAARHLDWLAGRNPWGYVMFTGLGEVYPKDAHLMTTRLTKRSIRGGLVDGPVYDRIFNSLKGVSITEPDRLAAFQGTAVYHDDFQDYSSNEPTMDGTASAILMWALASVSSE